MFVLRYSLGGVAYTAAVSVVIKPSLSSLSHSLSQKGLCGPPQVGHELGPSRDGQARLRTGQARLGTDPLCGEGVNFDSKEVLGRS